MMTNEMRRERKKNRKKEKRERETNDGTTTTWKSNNDRGSVPVVSYSTNIVGCVCVYFHSFFAVTMTMMDLQTHMSLSLSACGNRKLYLYWLISL
jgi:hypothetical protein